MFFSVNQLVMLTLFLYTSASSFRSRKFSCLCTSNVLFDKCVFCTMSQIYNIEYSNIIRVSWETSTFALKEFTWETSTFALKEFTWITNKLTNISRGGWELLLCATNGCISLFFTNLLTSIESRNESLKHSRRWNCCILDVIMHNFPMKISYRMQTSHPTTSHLYKVFSSMLFPKIYSGFTCLCHEIYRVESVGLKSSSYAWKIMIFANMWNLGQFREKLIFCE